MDAHRRPDMNGTRIRKQAERRRNCQRNVNTTYVTIARRHTHIRIVRQFSVRG